MSQSGCATPRPSHHLVQAERRVDSRLARELTEKGLVAFDTGDLAEAERLFREAVDVDVAFGPAHNNLGKVYFELEKMYLAAWEFEYAIKLMPHHPGPRNNLGLVLETAYRYDESVDVYEQALEITPDDPEIIGNLVRARIRRGDRLTGLKPLLEHLVLTAHRPEWRAWGEEQLARAKREEPGSAALTPAVTP